MSETIRALGFSLSPLFILLFACEMCALEDGLPVSGKASDRLVAWYVLKLPASILLPLFLSAPGAALVLLADALSMARIAKARRENRRKGGCGNDA